MVTFEQHRRLPMCHLGSSRDGRLTLAAKMEFGWFRLTHQYWKYWLFVVLAITGGISVPSLKSATGQTWRMTEGAAPTQPAAAEALSETDSSDPGSLERGTILRRYALLELVAGGGMGLVYLAYDPEL